MIDVGVIGVGSLGQWHARVYSENERCRLMGVYDRDSSRARDVAERYGTRVFEHLSDLVAVCEAVSVAVPTDLHRDVATVALTAGVHVLVEKPIAANTADARALVDLAQAVDRVLQVGHVERFNPVMTFLEDHLDRPRFIEASRLAAFPPPRPGVVPRGTEVSVVLDLMIHDLEIILHLVHSPVASVHAVGVPVLTPNLDIANARLVFENGCVANVTASRISAEQVRKIRVFQGDSYVSLDYQQQAGRLYRKEDGEIVAREVPIEKGDALERELDSFLDCVAEGKRPRVDGQRAFEALHLAEQIQAMGDSGAAAG